jgi:hypothetical protein
MIKIKTIGQKLPFKKRHGFAQSLSSALFAPLFLGKPMFPIRWLPAAVHDGQYQNVMILDAIKNSVRKASGEATSNVFIYHTI